MRAVPGDYNLPLWHDQPFYVEIWLEKEALANLFEPIVEKYGITFVPCRGYPSLSLLYDCSKRFMTVPGNREIRVLYFGDFDMRGLNIQETIEKSLRNDFNIRVKVFRCALTKEQIDQYQLPPNPAKAKDTMARGWIETHGDVAWELDAVEPKILTSLVESSILQQIDKVSWNARLEKIRVNRDWLQRAVDQYMQKNSLEGN